jgi:hypothetical protein
MKPFMFLLGLIVVLGGLTITTIRTVNKLRTQVLSLKPLEACL